MLVSKIANMIRLWICEEQKLLTFFLLVDIMTQYVCALSNVFRFMMIHWIGGMPKKIKQNKMKKTIKPCKNNLSGRSLDPEKLTPEP